MARVRGREAERTCDEPDDTAHQEEREHHNALDHAWHVGVDHDGGVLG